MATSSVARREAEVYVTKLEAARRQIDVAIKLFFANEDALAIQTLAAAGYRISRDLLKKRGKNDFADILRGGIYSMAKDACEADLSREELIQKHGDRLGRVLFIIANLIAKNGADFTETDINISGADERTKTDLDNLSRIPNYLKHADRDPREVLKLNDVDNETLILRAIIAYAFLSPLGKTSTMTVYSWYWQAGNWNPDVDPKYAKENTRFIEQLIPMTTAQRRRACRRALCRSGASKR